MGERDRHPDVAELVAYCVGELPAARREAVAAHLSGCPSCRRLLREHERFVHPIETPDPSGATDDRTTAWERLRRRLRGNPDDS